MVPNLRFKTNIWSNFYLTPGFDAVTGYPSDGGWSRLERHVLTCPYTDESRKVQDIITTSEPKQ